MPSLFGNSIFDAMTGIARERQERVDRPEDFVPRGKPTTDRPILDDDLIGDDEETGFTGRTIKEETDTIGDEFQVNIPDWLRKFSEEGFGQEFLRSSKQLGGTPLSEQTNIASRGLREQSFLQGASGSGFAGDKIRQLNLDRGKALEKLEIGIEGQNEATKRQALSQLKDIELFNEQVTQDFENMSEIEQLNALQRQFQLEAAQKQFKSQTQSTAQQLGNLGVTAGLGLGGAGFLPGFGIAAAGGLFSLFG